MQLDQCESEFAAESKNSLTYTRMQMPVYMYIDICMYYTYICMYIELYADGR